MRWFILFIVCLLIAIFTVSPVYSQEALLSPVSQKNIEGELVAVHPDGSYFVVWNEEAQEIRFIASNSGELIYMLSNVPYFDRATIENADCPALVIYDYDNQQGTAWVYLIDTGRLLAQGDMVEVTFSSDKSHFLINRHSMGLWRTGVYETCTGKPIIKRLGRGMLLSDNHQWLALRSEASHDYQTINLSTHRIVSKYPYYPLAFSSDGHYFAAAESISNTDGGSFVHLIDLDSNTILQTYTGNSARFNSDSTFVYVTGINGASQIIRITTGKIIAETGIGHSATIDPTWRYLIETDMTGFVQIHDLASGSVTSACCIIWGGFDPTGSYISGIYTERDITYVALINLETGEREIRIEGNGVVLIQVEII